MLYALLHYYLKTRFSVGPLAPGPFHTRAIHFPPFMSLLLVPLDSDWPSLSGLDLFYSSTILQRPYCLGSCRPSPRLPPTTSPTILTPLPSHHRKTVIWRRWDESCLGFVAAGWDRNFKVVKDDMGHQFDNNTRNSLRSSFFVFSVSRFITFCSEILCLFEEAMTIEQEDSEQINRCRSAPAGGGRRGQGNEVNPGLGALLNKHWIVEMIKLM